MIEIRFHGSGGHGAVMASKFLADAAARGGRQAQSFASYGALRRGGNVESYVRISDLPVRPHCKMYYPDWVVLMDEGLLKDPSVLAGLKEEGHVLINSPKPAGAFAALAPFPVHMVDAFGIAKEKGLFMPGGMPVINTTLLGALVRLLGPVRLEDLKEVILGGTPRAEKNVECAQLGHDRVVSTPQGWAREEGVETSSPGSSSGRPYPVYDPEKMKRCNRCQICYMVCPSLAVGFQKEPFSLCVNRAICSGCGICIEECPRGAISWGGSENE